MEGSAGPRYGIRAEARQSPAVDFTTPIDEADICGQTILITGGASGIGAALVRRWAMAGATVIFGDVDVAGGRRLETDVRAATAPDRVYFYPCDVTSWADQVRLFRRAVARSPHGGIDHVVPNAGIVDRKQSFALPPSRLDQDAATLADVETAEIPKSPNLAVVDINLTAVLHTVHLALYHLPRNPGSIPPASQKQHDQSLKKEQPTRRDRHILLVGSMASIAAIPYQALYGATKHAVLGLFRSLRTSAASTHGIRLSLICPYFTATPMFEGGAMLLAGGALTELDDVVEASTRLVADRTIVGRAIAISPRFSEVMGMPAKQRVGPFWEIYPDDLEDVELFTRNVVAWANRVVEVRGWIGWARDLANAVRSMLPSPLSQ